MLAGLLLPLFIALGFWQLQRANFHREQLQIAETRRAQASVSLDTVVELREQDSRYLPVSLQGQWLAPVFLLDNETRGQKVGYDVIGLMELRDGRKVFVNRGWIAGPSLRSQLPIVPPPTDRVVEQGELYFGNEVLLEGELFAEADWPRRIAKLHLPGMARMAGVEVLPVLVRLKEGSPSALTAGWPVTNIAPEKNIAYAVQWFGMAVALIVFYLALAFRRDN